MKSFRNLSFLTFLSNQVLKCCIHVPFLSSVITICLFVCLYLAHPLPLPFTVPSILPHPTLCVGVRVCVWEGERRGLAGVGGGGLSPRIPTQWNDMEFTSREIHNNNDNNTIILALTSIAFADVQENHNTKVLDNRCS